MCMMGYDSELVFKLHGVCECGSIQLVCIICGAKPLLGNVFRIWLWWWVHKCTIWVPICYRVSQELKLIELTSMFNWGHFYCGATTTLACGIIGMC